MTQFFKRPHLSGMQLHGKTLPLQNANILMVYTDGLTTETLWTVSCVQPSAYLERLTLTF